MKVDIEVVGEVKPEVSNGLTEHQVAELLQKLCTAMLTALLNTTFDGATCGVEISMALPSDTPVTDDCECPLCQLRRIVQASERNKG